MRCADRQNSIIYLDQQPYRENLTSLEAKPQQDGFLFGRASTGRNCSTNHCKPKNSYSGCENKQAAAHHCRHFEELETVVDGFQSREYYHAVPAQSLASDVAYGKMLAYVRIVDDDFEKR